MLTHPLVEREEPARRGSSSPGKNGQRGSRAQAFTKNMQRSRGALKVKQKKKRAGWTSPTPARTPLTVMTRERVNVYLSTLQRDAQRVGAPACSLI